MKDYREISSDDERAWEIEEPYVIHHIVILVSIVLVFVLLAGVWLFKL